MREFSAYLLVPVVGVLSWELAAAAVTGFIAKENVVGITLLAVAKGYMQKNQGFDSAELAWVMTRGYNTHILKTGIRYFSFFTDAANYGCGMGLSLVVFFLSSFYTKNKYLKIFYLIVAAGAGYGLLISGTRASMAVPIRNISMFSCQLQGAEELK